jgi:hypothetical protein
VIAPPALAFVPIGPGFFAHGFIAGRAFGMREGPAIVRGERIARGAVARRRAFRWSVERGREFAGRRVDWRSAGGGWREARQGGVGGWRRGWR